MLACEFIRNVEIFNVSRALDKCSGEPNTGSFNIEGTEFIHKKCDSVELTITDGGNTTVIVILSPSL